MSDLRYDPIFGHWACISEQRLSRPIEFQQFNQRRAGIDCPFCRGNESVTPPAIIEWANDQEADEKTWLARAIPNKFPAFDSALKIIESLDPLSPVNGTVQSPENVTEPDEKTTDSGRHFQEVIVLSPRHVASLSGLNDDELLTSFQVFQQRVAWHSKQDDIAHVCLFMNCRPMAGASIEHSHFQLIASPVCTEQVRQRVDRMNQLVEKNAKSGSSVWQDELAKELKAATRVVCESDNFVVYCPFASRYSNQLRIAPKPSDSTGCAFPDLEAVGINELAKLCRRWVNALDGCLDNPAYNLIFHLPPVDTPAPWFVDLVPRFPQAAGFELATDCWVNPVSPESAAEQYRTFAKES